MNTTAKEARHKLVEAVVYATIAFQVSTTREARGLTQQQLADKAGVSVATIQRIERGDRPNVTLASLRDIASALDCGLICHFTDWEEFFAAMRTHFVPPSPFSVKGLI